MVGQHGTKVANIVRFRDPRSDSYWQKSLFLFSIFLRNCGFKVFSHREIFQKFLLEFFKNNSENFGSKS